MKNSRHQALSGETAAEDASKPRHKIIRLTLVVKSPPLSAPGTRLHAISIRNYEIHEYEPWKWCIVKALGEKILPKYLIQKLALKKKNNKKAQTKPKQTLKQMKNLKNWGAGKTAWNPTWWLADVAERWMLLRKALLSWADL